MFLLSNCTSGQKAAFIMAWQKTDLHTGALCLKLSISRCASAFQRRFLSKMTRSAHLENCFPPLSYTRELILLTHNRGFSHFSVSPHNCFHVVQLSGFMYNLCSNFSTRWLSPDIAAEWHIKEFATGYGLHV